MKKVTIILYEDTSQYGMVAFSYETKYDMRYILYAEPSMSS